MAENAGGRDAVQMNLLVEKSSSIGLLQGNLAAMISLMALGLLSVATFLTMLSCCLYKHFISSAAVAAAAAAASHRHQQHNRHHHHHLDLSGNDPTMVLGTIVANQTATTVDGEPADVMLGIGNGLENDIDKYKSHKKYQQHLQKQSNLATTATTGSMLTVTTTLTTSTLQNQQQSQVMMMMMMSTATNRLPLHYDNNSITGATTTTSLATTARTTTTTTSSRGQALKVLNEKKITEKDNSDLQDNKYKQLIMLTRGGNKRWGHQQQQQQQVNAMGEGPIKDLGTGGGLLHQQQLYGDDGGIIISNEATCPGDVNYTTHTLKGELGPRINNIKRQSSNLLQDNSYSQLRSPLDNDEDDLEGGVSSSLGKHPINSL